MVNVTSVAEPNDNDGSLSVKYKLSFTDSSGRKTESVEKTAKLQGLLTYGRDLEQTNTTFTIVEVKKATISAFNTSNWSEYFTTTFTNNQNLSVKVVVDSFYNVPTTEGLSLVYHLEIPNTDSTKPSFAKSFSRIINFDDLYNNRQSKADATTFTFSVKDAFTNQVFANQINGLNWKSYLNFTPTSADNKDGVPVEVMVQDYDLIAGTATLNYQILFKSKTSSTTKTANLVGLKKLDSEYLVKNFSVDWGAKDSGKQIYPSILTKDNITTYLSNPIFNTLNFANVTALIEQVSKENDVNGTVQITYKLMATNGKTGSALQTISMDGRKVTTVPGFWSHTKALNSANATWTLKSSSSGASTQLASSIKAPSTSSDKAWTDVFNTPIYSIIRTLIKLNWILQSKELIQTIQLVH